MIRNLENIASNSRKKYEHGEFGNKKWKMNTFAKKSLIVNTFLMSVLKVGIVSVFIGLVLVPYRRAVGSGARCWAAAIRI